MRSMTYEQGSRSPRAGVIPIIRRAIVLGMVSSPRAGVILRVSLSANYTGVSSPRAGVIPTWARAKPGLRCLVPARGGDP